MLHRTVSVTGFHLHATDGAIGHVDDFLFDEKDWSIRYLVIDTSNWIGGKRVLVSTAVVTGVEEFGLFAQGIEFPAEGMIRVSALSDDYYHYDRASHSLTGRRAGNAFKLGDRIRVEVVRVDVDKRELDFRLVDRFARPRGAKGHVVRTEKHRPTKQHPANQHHSKQRPAKNRDDGGRRRKRKK